MQRVEVFADSSGGRPLVSYEGAELAGNLGRPGLTLEPDQRPALGPAAHAMVYMWIPLAAPIHG